MTKVLKISSLAIVLIILCAPSCEDEQEAARRDEDLLREERIEIRKEFETDYLDEAYLFASEETAKQKLYDLSDYFAILSDTSLDKSFRIKAGEMIQNIVLSDKIKLSLFTQDNERGNENEVRILIQKVLDNELPPHSFSFDSVRVHEPLRRMGNNTYSGSLSFVQSYAIPSGSGLAAQSFQRYASIHMIKEDKIFGADTLNIWSVRLGEIR